MTALTPRLAPTARRPGRRRVVVIGNGMAGARTVEEIVARAPETADITVFGAEPYGNYNRILLSDLLAGRAREDDLYLNPLGWYAEHGVTLRAGVAVAHVDRTARLVLADDGSATPYDTLVVATGSRPFVPDIAGARLPDGRLRPGVFVFRTLDDARAMIARARDSTAAVVIGGGLLGLEAARGLQHHGVAVTVVHAGRHLMDRQLDPDAGAVLRRSVEGLGIGVRTEGRTTAVDLDGGRVAGVRLADGTALACDTVVVAAGVRPNTDLGRRAGLTVDRGLVVDDHMRAVDDPDVYVVGECAQHRDTVYGLVAPVWEQARVVADHLTGRDRQAAYGGSRVATKLKVAGVDVAAMGLAEPERDGDESVVFSEPRRGVYKRLVVRDGRLVGATLVGDVGRAASLVQTFDRDLPLPEDRAELLFDLGAPAGGTDVAAMSDETQVCNCNGVAKGALVRCVREGATTPDAVMDATRAGRGCGSCKGLVAAVVTQAVAEGADEVDAGGAACGCDAGPSATAPAGTTVTVDPERGCTPADLRRIADVAERYALPVVRVAGAGLALVGVREEDLAQVSAELGLPEAPAPAPAG